MVLVEFFSVEMVKDPRVCDDGYIFIFKALQLFKEVSSGIFDSLIEVFEAFEKFREVGSHPVEDN